MPAAAKGIDVVPSTCERELRRLLSQVEALPPAVATAVAQVTRSLLADGELGGRESLVAQTLLEALDGERGRAFQAA